MLTYDTISHVLTGVRGLGQEEGRFTYRVLDDALFDFYSGGAKNVRFLAENNPIKTANIATSFI